MSKINYILALGVLLLGAHDEFLVYLHYLSVNATNFPIMHDFYVMYAQRALNSLDTAFSLMFLARAHKSLSLLRLAD
jgi:hypothetical protein